MTKDEMYTVKAPLEPGMAHRQILSYHRTPAAAMMAARRRRDGSTAVCPSGEEVEELWCAYCPHLHTQAHGTPGYTCGTNEWIKINGEAD